MNGVVDRALAGLAAGRIALAAVSLAAPDTMARWLGAAPGPELAYLTRIFGARAAALGTGYLASSGRSRRLWQRLAFACDVSDTLTGLHHLGRRDLPPGAAPALTALTGAYAAIGAARIVADTAGDRAGRR